MSSKPEQQLKVGDWWYLPEQDKLVKVDAFGEVTATADLDNLCQKAMNYFIVNAGRLITRDEILADVWGVRDVSDGRISRVIRVLRVALGDDSREPRYIETIPKRGFRFIAPVAEVAPIVTLPDSLIEPEPADNGATPEPQPVIVKTGSKRVGRWYHWVAMISMLGCGLLYLAWQQFYVQEQDVAGVPFKRFQPVTSLKGLEVHAAMSPDGNYLAFNHIDAQSQQQIILKNLESSELKVLVDDTANLSNVAWRPDGKAMAYIKLTRGHSCELRLLTLSSDLKKVASDEVLTKCSNNSLVGRLSWSPDGASIVFPNNPENSPNTVLMLYPVFGGKVEQLTTPPPTSVGDFAARFAKNGNQLVFLRDVGGGSGQIWLLDLDKRTTEMLIQLENNYPGNVDWYDHDTKIIYPATPNSISTIDIKTKKVETLFQTDNDALEVSVSTQNRILATVGQFRLVTFMKLNNQLTNPKPTKELIFESSRSERMIQIGLRDDLPSAVLSNRSGLFQFWFHYPDGRQVQVSDFKNWIMLREMVFSPDGKRLLASVGNEIWIFGVGEKPLLLSNQGQTVRGPSWSHDGRFVYFSSAVQGRWQISKTDTQNLNQSVVALDLDYYQESPNGEYQVVRRSLDAGYELHLRANGEVIELPIDSKGVLLPHFVLREKALYYSTILDNNQLEIRRFDLASRQLTAVDQGSINSTRRFSVSLDEQYIYLPSTTIGNLDIAEMH
jgi:Tol biopolymer transport system component/DNA-binding winged helix-turn-helix (wHTH) protein